MKNKTRILILIDCQNDFIDGSLANKDAQACIPAIVDKIDDFDGDFILLTMDTHGEDYLDTPEGKKLPVKHCIYNTEGWQINDKVQAALKRKIASGMRILYIPKNTFGSVSGDKYIPKEDYFYARNISSKSLVDVIEDLHAREDKNIDIEMCGFISDICVLHNAIILKSSTYDFAEITVDSKCCAGSTPENHQKAMDLMKIGQINII